MGRWQGRSLKKPTGGRVWPRRGKRRREMGSDFREPGIGPKKYVRERTRGGGEKIKVLAGETVNVINPSTGRSQKTKIITVVENPADSHFVRRNILTKGAVIDTEIGRARITSRPGQHGTINAVLIEQKSG
ncbi:MAG: 30S ribosomal protein S8e [Candidatus Hadarchaeales archaeon]